MRITSSRFPNAIAMTLAIATPMLGFLAFNYVSTRSGVEDFFSGPMASTAVVALMILLATYPKAIQMLKRVPNGQAFARALLIVALGCHFLSAIFTGRFIATTIGGDDMLQRAEQRRIEAQTLATLEQAEDKLANFHNQGIAELGALAEALSQRVTNSTALRREADSLTQRAESERKHGAVSGQPGETAVYQKLYAQSL